ncbi:3-hydroxyacyl-ACP dehydratase FabZ family protein [Chromobacterium vaccinii]|uniref:3-hydroxyacyl-ACP dehydratase FabZ family protein n=1 Tax=Chromobacterium vaccinii TaxID=1108595 RepID=UPI000696A220|nr:hypothetical protein [Chromobacterium vaccinii]SUX30494.1 (3R)-hydroxymyristoyl-[acyl-carrier-protein] dehydratase [Chromobacterium vaccinii]
MAARQFSGEELAALLPHAGDAFFLSDAEVDGWKASGGASWRADHPHLRGHFPGEPIVPGVYLLEAAAQLAGVAIRCGAEGWTPETLGVLAGVRKSYFHRFVRPDERVDYALEVKPTPGSAMYAVSGLGEVGGDKVLTVELTIAGVRR